MLGKNTGIRGWPVLMVSFTVLLISGAVSEVRAAVEDEVCLECHDDYEGNLAFTSHQLRSEAGWETSDVTCASCHDGAEQHVEDPSVENIDNPARLGAYEVTRVCSECHIPHVSLDNYGFDPHAVEQLNCSSCHKVHDGRQALLLDDSAEFCESCHTGPATAFARRSNHPLRQGAVTCLSCHKYTRRQDQNLTYDLDRVCRDCHPEQAGPFPFEHEAVNAYSVEGGGCIECHSPHGSDSDRLVRQRGNELCRQCHFPARHSTAHGGIWTDYACQSCHIDTHGSFVSNLYLDPDLTFKFGSNCLQTGCHSLNN